jgi:hypothetical protein
MSTGTSQSEPMSTDSSPPMFTIDLPSVPPWPSLTPGYFPISVEDRHTPRISSLASGSRRQYSSFIPSNYPLTCYRTGSTNSTRTVGPYGNYSRRVHPYQPSPITPTALERNREIHYWNGANFSARHSLQGLPQASAPVIRPEVRADPYHKLTPMCALNLVPPPVAGPADVCCSILSRYATDAIM